MNNERRSFLRSVMETAWYVFRNRHIPGSNIRTFGDALRNAWAFLKPRALVASGPTLHLRSMLQSPIRLSLRGQAYAETRARSAGYYTSMVGA